MHKNIKRNLLYIVPVFLFLYSVLVLKIKKITFDFSGLTWISDNKTFFDLFSYYKAQVIIFSAILAVGILIYDYVKGDIKFKFDYKKYLVFFIFAFFLILSFLFSDYKEIAMIGMFDRYEGFMVNISYI
ncbi:hypothetical protein QUF55_10315, partial [Clostridiaceae bacterium HSG29]|nr:hypothetical protein [Clostridiaceae bacterium HSG29]